MFLRNRNIISKIKGSKVTDCADLSKKAEDKSDIIFLRSGLNICLSPKKNRLNETVLLSTHNMFWLRNKIKKIFNSALSS